MNFSVRLNLNNLLTMFEKGRESEYDSFRIDFQQLAEEE